MLAQSYHPGMRIDCHVHISACTPGHGWMSDRLLNSLPFRFMRWSFGIEGTDEKSERRLEQLLADTIEQTPELDAAVVLAFDAVHDRDGRLDEANTHLYVTNITSSNWPTAIQRCFSAHRSIPIARMRCRKSSGASRPARLPEMAADRTEF